MARHLNVERLENLAEDLSFIREKSAPGATRHDLRRLSVALRGIAENGWQQRWKELGLTGQPTVACRIFTGHLVSPTGVAIVGGAEDVEDPEPPAGSLVIDGLVIRPGLTVTAIDADGQLVRAGERIGVGDIIEDSATHWHEDLRNHPFRDVELPLSDFFSSVAIAHSGLRITRRQIITYVANKRGGAHEAQDNPRKPKPYEEPLNILSTSSGFGGKDMTMYIFMSIAQDIARSEVVDRFIAEVRALR